MHNDFGDFSTPSIEELITRIKREVSPSTTPSLKKQKTNGPLKKATTNISKNQKEKSHCLKAKKISSSSQVPLDKDRVVDDDALGQPQSKKKAADVTEIDQMNSLSMSDVDDIKSFVKKYVTFSSYYHIQFLLL